MNAHETLEIRNLTAAELDEVSGGNPVAILAVIGMGTVMVWAYEAGLAVGRSGGIFAPYPGTPW